MKNKARSKSATSAPLWSEKKGNEKDTPTQVEEASLNLPPPLNEDNLLKLSRPGKILGSARP